MYLKNTVRASLPSVISLEGSSTRVSFRDHISIISPDCQAQRAMSAPYFLTSYRPILTIPEGLEEYSMVIDTLLGAENTGLSQLVIQNPFTRGRLHDICSIKTMDADHVSSQASSGIT